jgi:uncharacterized damage-inducible protein DinB
MASNAEIVLPEFMRYNTWANQQLLAACKSLSEAQLAMAAEGAYGTIRATLQHIIRAEASYLKLISGSRPDPDFAWDAPPGVAEMGAYTRQVGEALEQAARQAGPNSQVTHVWDDETHRFRALALFIQIVNHGVEHRTNITMTLAQAKLPTPDLDGWAYLVRNLERFELKR